MTTAQAERVRQEAQTARLEAAETRLSTRRILRETRRRRHELLLSCARASTALDRPVRSPWSDLPWQRPRTDLDQVLVPLP